MRWRVKQRMYDLFGRCCSMAGIALGLACSFGSIAFGADANAVTVKKLLTGLNNPHGIAVRPDGKRDAYEVFVAESGAGQVIKARNEGLQKRIDVVSGFSIKPVNDDSFSSPGVYSLHFLDHMRLVVAGGDDDGAPFVRIFELPEPESPLTADQHKHEANLPENGKKPKLDAGVFRGIARTQNNDRVGDFLFVAAPAHHGSSSLISIPIRSGTLGDVVPVPFENNNGDSQIGAITVGNTGYAIVAVNSVNDPKSPSSLAFFNPLNRRILLKVRTDLQRIVALAYSPKSGNLFVANSPSNFDNGAGIFRIDSVNQRGESACIAVKIADVQSPTALAFAPDGALFVTASGDRKSKDTGVLLKITGDLATAK
jgi:hypothetical protein